MKRKLSILLGVVGVLLVVAVMSFVITGKEPLYGQGRRGSNMGIPDLTGTWTLTSAGYFFEDVTDTTTSAGDPDPFEVSPEDFVITEQTGRVFAGVWDSRAQKVTGVILPDGTVSVQFFETTELRLFGTGSISVRGSTPEISGFFHFFDDFGHPSASDTNMGSGFFLLVKQ